MDFSNASKFISRFPQRENVHSRNTSNTVPEKRRSNRSNGQS